MFDIQFTALPESALLKTYADQEECYTDCYAVDVPIQVDFSSFVEAFYTTPLFKVERAILKIVANKPSTDSWARKVSNGQVDHFAAWTVEGRANDQLLMCDISDRTRSWFMTVEKPTVNTPMTRLYFGSAVVPLLKGKNEKPTMGLVFRALLGFHKLYSRALLAAAKARIMKNAKILSNETAN